MYHEKSTQLINSCARAFRVETDISDIDTWSAGFTMAKALDTLVDDDHIYDSGRYAKKLLAGETIPYTTDEQADFIRSTYSNLDPETKNCWRYSASQLGYFALKRLDADTIEEYIDVVSEESQLMGDILKVENDTSRSDELQRGNFNSWMDQMAKTAYLADTLSDFIRDHNEGNMNIQPTLRSASILARHTLKELVAFTQVTPLPIYGAIARRSTSKSVEKLRQPGFMKEQFGINRTRGHSNTP